MLIGMSNWFTLALGDGITAAGLISRMEDAFAAHPQHPDAAVFIHHVAEGDLHCTVTAYFSPAATALAQAFGAMPCPRPAAKNLDLLVGDPKCRERLL